MSPIFTTLAPGLFQAGAKLIDRLIPDPAQRVSLPDKYSPFLPFEFSPV